MWDKEHRTGVKSVDGLGTPVGAVVCGWMSMRGGKDKAALLQISLGRDTTGELLCLCTASLLGAALGVSGHGRSPLLQPVLPSNPSSHKGKSCPRNPQFLIKSIIQQPVACFPLSDLAVG